MAKPTTSPAKRPQPERVRFVIRKTSLGLTLVAAGDKGIRCILLGDDAGPLRRELAERLPQAELVSGDRAFAASMASVFERIDRRDGKLAKSPTLPLDPGGTAFQKKVWRALQKIPAGRTATYSQIAQSIGAPRAVRAVGAACGANPIAVFIPCHRALRKDGGLAGFYWGIERKRALLEREGARHETPGEAVR
jgi:AraC family transcriptional regulator of adaptative response/methylated-DNA-[protein]-cysteine methyltransferase